MSDPQRIRRHGEDFARVLLASVDRDGPTDDERRAVLATVGIAVPGVVAPGAPAAAAKAVGGGLGKAIVAGCSVALVGAAIAIALVDHPVASTPVASPPIARAPASAPATAPTVSSFPAASAVPAPPEPPLFDVSSLPGAPPVLAAPRPSASATPTHASDARGGLSEEIALIDQARRALAAGDPTHALELLDVHDRDHGALTHEAAALRVEALAARGDTAEASRIARAFLAEHPGSPVAHRIRSLAHIDGDASIP